MKALTAAAVMGLACCKVVWADNNSVAEAIARKNNCLGCHAVGTKLVGPAYKDVAAKYANNAEAATLVASNIRKGGSGKWGDLPMPPQAQLSDADLKKLTDWILSLK